MKTGLDKIAKERDDHFRKGFDANHDKMNDEGQLAQAVVYSITLKEEDYPLGWRIWFMNKMRDKPLVERLAIAGSLCAAEIDRLNLENG